MSPEPAPGAAWGEIVRRPTLEAFATAFAPNVALYTSIARGPIVGIAGVHAYFRHAAATYETIAFTHEAHGAGRTYMEWEGTAFGGQAVAGVTILRRSPAGLIDWISLYHRPYDLVLQFSAAMRTQLQGQVADDLFASPAGS